MACTYVCLCREYIVVSMKVYSFRSIDIYKAHWILQERDHKTPKRRVSNKARTVSDLLLYLLNQQMNPITFTTSYLSIIVSYLKGWTFSTIVGRQPIYKQVPIYTCTGNDIISNNVFMYLYGVDIFLIPLSIKLKNLRI